MADNPRFKVEFTGFFYGTEDASVVLAKMANNLQGSEKNEEINRHGSFFGADGQGGYDFTVKKEKSTTQADEILAGENIAAILALSSQERV